LWRFLATIPAAAAAAAAFEQRLCLVIIYGSEHAALTGELSRRYPLQLRAIILATMLATSCRSRKNGFLQ